MLEGFDYDKIADIFEVSAHGTDRLGRNTQMYIQYDGSISGANPYYWGPGRSGHQFSLVADAQQHMKHAAHSYDCSSIDKESIQILQYQVKMKKETTFVGVVETRV